MKTKTLPYLLLTVFVFSFTLSLAEAQTNVVTGSISASNSVIVVHGTVTLTCTYTSSLNLAGTGTLQISGPYPDPDDPDAFDSWINIHYWDGGTGTKHSPALTSGVPVSFTQQLDSAGYYKFRWLCKGGGVDGAYTEVMVQVVETPTILPEAPPIVALVLGVAALGVFLGVAQKRSSKTHSAPSFSPTGLLRNGMSSPANPF